MKQRRQNMQTNFKTTLNTMLATLITQRQVWEDGVYKQANSELYAILEQCGKIYDMLKADKKHARAFNALAEEQGIKFNKGTSLALKIVRVVFGKQNNREHAYALVIKIWYDERTEQQTLTNFVIERGGIENIRRSASSLKVTKYTAEDYRDIAESALSGQSGTQSFTVKDYMLSDSENDTDYLVALVRYDSAGVGHIIYGSNKKALVNAALATAGKELDTRMKQSTQLQSKDEQKKLTANNIGKFISLQQSATCAA